MDDLSELSYYGAPIYKRKPEIADKIKNPNSTYPIEFQGHYQHLPVISVKINFPVYRLENGRTKTLQRQYLAEHPDELRDLFTRDHDSYEAQYAQHLILSDIIDDEGLREHFKKERIGQLEPIICTKEGVVVNGNRRLCTWRTLYYDNPKRYEYYQNINIAILPDCDEESIRDLEKRLQIQNPMKAEYKWHALALMCQEELQRKVTPKPTPTSVGQSIGYSAQEVSTLIQARKFAEKYLESIGKKDIWSEVDKHKYAFTEMVKYKKRLSDNVEDSVLFEKICFVMIEHSKEDRLYNQIKEVYTNLHPIAKKLGFELELPSKQPEPPEIQLIKGGDGGQTTFTDKTPNGVELVEAIDKEKDKTKIVDTVQEEIKVQKEVKTEKNSKEFLLNQISKAADLLNTAVYNGLRPESDKEGIEKQLDLIEENIKKIKKWLEGQ